MILECVVALAVPQRASERPAHQLFTELSPIVGIDRPVQKCVPQIIRSEVKLTVALEILRQGSRTPEGGQILCLNRRDSVRLPPHGRISPCIVTILALPTADATPSA